jgi:acetyltransferase-like isoleucine patch superfamily enzyme
MLIISEKARVSPLAAIEDSVRGSRITIEEDVVIDAFVKIKPAGGNGDLIIRRGSYINSGTVIYTGNGVNIGEHVLIAANCTLAPVNHEFKEKNRLIVEQRFKPSRGGILIEDDVWIGVNSVILDGAYIGRGCVIGACSLVKGTLERFGIYGGNPLIKIGERS